MVIDGMKKCARCGEIKSATGEFYPAKNLDGFSVYCCACESARHAERKAREPEKVRAQARAARARWLEKNPERAAESAERSKAKKRDQTAAKYAALATPEGTKRCACCMEVKAFDLFAKDKRREHGLAGYCLECNRAKTAARAKASYHRNAEAVKARQNERRKGAKFKEQQKEYRKRPEVRAIAREREKLRSCLVRQRKYVNGVISSELEMEGRMTRAEWNAILAEFDHACAYCGSVEKMTIEHLTPLKRGGKTEVGNIVPACLPCNSSKQAKTAEEFAPDLAPGIRERAMLH